MNWVSSSSFKAIDLFLKLPFQLYQAEDIFLAKQ